LMASSASRLRHQTHDFGCDKLPNAPVLWLEKRFFAFGGENFCQDITNLSLLHDAQALARPDPFPFGCLHKVRIDLSSP